MTTKQELYKLINESLQHWADLIKDAEWRLGSYLANEGCEKTDPYAQRQINNIKVWTIKANESMALFLYGED